ncbi:VOC family protein [Kutzneria buriramensis]|uniref:Glyoxalase/bleomycin resistance protein/dioxygenase superfamily protein n=1 Tax=Kutzneria buriramensis TaxID=1045776 RepID=A0A3E0I6T6_9PSEU|nr:VOC family protein [Kutzneria buriramensis]REH53855.1 glyoxalase/bleomycin resistance protein/dioxygenase superfamily protein [Kutzneria buriramensis]
MALHGLASFTIGVPDVAATVDYYEEFGLTAGEDGWLSSVDGGRQLRVVESPTRRLLEVVVRADHGDDLGAISSRLSTMDIVTRTTPDSVTAVEPATGVRAVVRIAPRLEQEPTSLPPQNGPGHTVRANQRAAGVLRENRVRPRRLGHVVIGSTDYPTTQRFFGEGLGFKLSDEISGEGAFLRCSTDHHNVLVLRAPVAYMHHSSWQVDDIDEVGRGAATMLEGHPERHVWGLGRHHAGSNFFWYLKDPAGNFSEYYSDMDCIVEDAVWRPEVLEGAKGLFNWGPPPPPSFLKPEDLGALMTGSHSVG